MKQAVTGKLSAGTDFDLFKAIMVQIENGACLTELLNWMLHDKCEDLMEDAEIYAALHPKDARHFLLERRLAICTLLINKTKRKLKPKQQEQIFAIEERLLQLCAFYARLYNAL
ncbi:hypothetical protein [Pedobacter africanus]|uniref:Uncharacterized protein n=1 Tax=Pedobacter africanus TaxID=151894 RepID=A0A1W2AE96_9SPHI|nr:hypothetical protein [Pedobacter africanus]SMC58910.1 hypothetical protein SAMN04488524_1343 [Pedobacter africanus]